MLRTFCSGKRLNRRAESSRRFRHATRK